MNWTVIIDGYAKKYLKRIPRKDADRIIEGNKDIWRRRIGSYRILYEIYEGRKLIYVSDIKRRASSTY